MAITDLPVLAMLRTRMQWNQARQRLVAENVANADMPNFRPRDLAEPSFDRATGLATGLAKGSAMGPSVAAAGTLAVTAPGHIATAGAMAGGDDPKRVKDFEVRPSGNGVNLEDEMMKAGDIQTDYQVAASLYQHSLTTLRIAIGKS